MMECKLCGDPTHDEEGWPLGTVLVFQKVNGKIQLAKDLVLGTPMHYVHEACLEALDDRQPGHC